jgi:hypothetical protein
MAKVVHFTDRIFAECSMCGLINNKKYEFTTDIRETTCKTCLKAYEAWKRRQREA